MPYYYELQIEHRDRYGDGTRDPEIIVAFNNGKRDKDVFFSIDYRGSAFREKFFESKIDEPDDFYDKDYVPQKNCDFGFINEKGDKCQFVVMQHYQAERLWDETRDYYYVDRLNYNKDTKTINCDLPKYVTNFINKLLSKEGAAQ